jgi:TRAP-type C4-dicarboxylate transport system substrate-binding protein
MTKVEPTGQVFIAHVEEDADVALEIALALEEAGYSTWIYEVDSIPGPSYLVQTGQAVERAKVTVVIISPHAISSRQVTKEVIRAHESDNEFIPILRGITHIEFQNRQPEWREAIGSAASIGIPPGGVRVIIPRIISGLKSFGITPSTSIEKGRIQQIRDLIKERVGRVPPPATEVALPPEEPWPEPVAAPVAPPKKAKAGKKWKKPVIIASGVMAIAAIAVLSVVFLAPFNGPAIKTTSTSMVSTPSSTPSPTPVSPPSPTPTSPSPTPTPTHTETPTSSPTPEPSPTPPPTPVTLKYTSFLPDTDPRAEVDTWFFNELANRSDGLLKVEYSFQANTGDPDFFIQALNTITEKGNADCGVFPLGALTGLAPLSQGLMLNYVSTRPDALALSAGELYKDFAPLREEWEITNNVKVLYFIPVDTLVLCTKKPAHSVADLQGLKIASQGIVVDTIQRLGAVPVVVPPSSLYESMSKGVVDGGICPFFHYDAYKLDEVAPYLTETWAGHVGVLITMINKDVWDALPDSLKEDAENLSKEAINRYFQAIMESNRAALKDTLAAGVQLYLWPETEREKAKNIVQPAQSLEWIQEVGADGEELLLKLEYQLTIYEPQSTYRSVFEMWQEVHGK